MVEPFEKVIDMHVILGTEKLAQYAEATVNLRGKTLFAKAEGQDVYAAIDGLVDKLDRQLVRHKERATSTAAFPPTPWVTEPPCNYSMSSPAIACWRSPRQQQEARAGARRAHARGRSRAGVERAFEALMAREHLGSTGLGQGVAIPHGRVAAIFRRPPLSCG
jgi:hypothetical protein